MSVFVKSGISVLRNSSISKPLLQSVRFNRKPRWLPIAKSKEFYVREPTPIDPEEHGILEGKYSEYRSSMAAIRQHLKTQAAQDDIKETKQTDKDDAADFIWMEGQVINWNKEVAVTREDRIANEMRLEEERLQKLMEQQAEKRLMESLAAENSFHANKVASKSFVTKENLDNEIEKMLDSRSDYNFALSRDGEILEGEYPNRMKESS